MVITHNGHNSKLLNIKCGVPQGSVLGPLLFILYINDIFIASNVGKLNLFADDTNLFITAQNIDDLFYIANKAINDIYIWTVCNKLTVNLKKSNFILFKPKKKDLDNITQKNRQILLANNVLDRVSSIKYLGIIIDENLTWNEHINKLTSKISNLIGIFYRKKNLFSNKNKKNLYFALAHSNIIYCIEIYGKAKSSVLHPLIVKCNCLLRILQDKPRLYCTKNLYIAYNTLPINVLHRQFIAKLMHRIIFDPTSIPNTITDLFLNNRQVHNHYTRNRHEFNIQADVCGSSINFIGPSNWNKLPLPLKSCPNYKKFEAMYKILLYDEL